jgi:hypothetical protein
MYNGWFYDFKIPIYSTNNTKDKYTLWSNADFLNLKVGGTYGNHFSLKGQWWMTKRIILWINR